MKNTPCNVRQTVWNTYIGGNIGRIKCPLCQQNDIQPFQFHCGHVVAQSKGGSFNISNLRPICAVCNNSIYTHDMRDFARKYYPNAPIHATFEKVQTELLTPIGTNDESIEKVPIEKVSTEPVPIEKVSTEHVPIEKVSIEQVPIEKVSIEQVLIEKVSIEPVQIENGPIEQVQIKQVQIEKKSIKQSPIGKKKIKQIPLGKKKFKQVPIEKKPIKQVQTVTSSEPSKILKKSNKLNQIYNISSNNKPICPRCLECFSRKQRLLSHLERKIPCKITNPHYKEKVAPGISSDTLNSSLNKINKLPTSSDNRDSFLTKVNELLTSSDDRDSFLTKVNELLTSSDSPYSSLDKINKLPASSDSPYYSLDKINKLPTPPKNPCITEGKEPICDYCSKEFSTTSNLNKHIRNFHIAKIPTNENELRLKNDELIKTQEELKCLKARLDELEKWKATL